MSPAPPAITTRGVDFAYGKNPVLHDVSLTVQPGEVVCLLGPNGVGKTTLVENLLGSLRPHAGSVRVFGTDPRRAGAAFWARIGLVQQNWTDHAKWRVKDQLEWIRSMQLTASARVATMAEVLDAVGLADKSNSRLSRLSGGQRRTLDFAAALLGRPELLILDEPTTGLDPSSKARLHDLIMERVDDRATVLMTTHDLSEAERLASRVVIMAAGRIIADGTVAELRERISSEAEVTWMQDGVRHVHATSNPERFLQKLDLDAISGLTVTRPTLEEAYLALVSQPAEAERSSTDHLAVRSDPATTPSTKEPRP
ncbi:MULTISPECIES: ABC transporter ATP-binding protein [unclassified Actinomyces]|uniref:ABC transporter ATP-binding protein n=1 Tax=unclassified Actinomyces TaxID=2609248 RepID=UPI000D5900A5|nr:MULTISPECIES: ABC transporter ATP-binding protein [unclassified Actinomyces]RAX21823.1 ABC transporter ATP-binding protein [Actinomyces sp. Z3]